MSHDPFYAQRAIEEREAALAATNPQARRAHLELAAEYARLAAATPSDGAGMVSPGAIAEPPQPSA